VRLCLLLERGDLAVLGANGDGAPPQAHIHLNLRGPPSGSPPTKFEGFVTVCNRRFQILDHLFGASLRDVGRPPVEGERKASRLLRRLILNHRPHRPPRLHRPYRPYRLRRMTHPAHPARRAHLDPPNFRGGHTRDGMRRSSPRPSCGLASERKFRTVGRRQQVSTCGSTGSRQGHGGWISW
jgi:hypothetical protein